MESHENVSDNRHIIEKADILECSRNTLTVDYFLSLSRKVLAVEIKFSRKRRINSRKEIKHRRFSGAVWAYKSVKLVFSYFYIYVVRGFKSAERYAEMLGFKHYVIVRHFFLHYVVCHLSVSFQSLIFTNPCVSRFSYRRLPARREYRGLYRLKVARPYLFLWVFCPTSPHLP